MEEPVLNSHNKAEWEPAQVTAFPANGPEGRLQVQYLIEKESSVMLLGSFNMPVRNEADLKYVYVKAQPPV